MTNPFAANIESKPEFRPLLNMGGLFDIPTCRWRRGMKGEMIKDAGRTYVLGIAGRGNTFKSVIAHWHEVRSFERYGIRQTEVVKGKTDAESDYNSVIFDTELSLQMERFNMIAKGSNLDVSMHYCQSSKTVVLTDMSVMLGDVFFDQIKKNTLDRVKPKKGLLETPFQTESGGAFNMIAPVGIEIDSLSAFRTTNVDAMVTKANVGESERNMEAMRDGAAKTQFLNEASLIMPARGMFLTMTAHLGDKVNLDPYAPVVKQLAALPKNGKFKNVPEKFTFLTNVCWVVVRCIDMVNKSTKAPEYPRDGDDNLAGDKDLKLVTLVTARNKHGGTEIPIDILISQNEGVLPELSQFNYCKSKDRYGIEGTLQHYSMTLYPECALSRTKVRGKINEDPKLRRAIELTSDLLQIIEFQHDFPKELLCTPEELYKDMVELGYDWNTLLDSRDYWTFDQYTHPVPFLSIYDLLEVRKGIKTLYWYPDPKAEGDKVKVKDKPDKVKVKS